MSAFHRAVLATGEPARRSCTRRTVVGCEDNQRIIIESRITNRFHDATGAVIQFFDEVAVLALRRCADKVFAGQQRRMHDVVRNVNEERIVFLTADEVDHFIGVAPSQFLATDVLLFDLFAAIQRVVVFSAFRFVVAWDTKVLVKARIEWVRTLDFHSQVPLAHHQGTIAGGPKQFRNG